MSTETGLQDQKQELHDSSKALAQGLIWGGAMLILMALWLAKDHPLISTAQLVILWILALAGLAAGTRLILTLRQCCLGKETFEDKLTHQRRLIISFLLTAGIILLTDAVYLAFAMGLQAFAESVGLALLGLIAVGSGLAHRHPVAPMAEPQGILEQLPQHATGLRNFLLAITVLCTGAFLWLAFGQKVGADWLPELAALLAEGMICLTCVFWLGLAKPGDKTSLNLRLLLLILGAMTGLILSLMVLGRAFLWRQDVFLGGIKAWQGDNSWKFWLCAYLGLVGLVLMFASLLLARSEVRTNPTLRQLLYGYNTVVTGLLLLVFLAAFNVVCYAAFPLTFEWTKTRGLTTLSPSSKNLLSYLKEPTTVYVLLPEGHPVYSDTKSLLNNCQAESNLFQVKFVSPDRDFREYEKLAQRFPEILPSARVARFDATSGRGLLLVYGQISEDISKKVPHTFIADRKLFDEPQSFHQKSDSVKVTRVFKGEVELMKELDFLVHGQTQRKIYILQGNDELNINDLDPKYRLDLRGDMSRLGIGGLVDRLRKENYQVQGLSFGRPNKEDKKDLTVYAQETGPEKRKDVPEDTWALVIPGPSREIPKENLDALERFMDRGGKMLVTVDLVLEPSMAKLKNSGMEEFLKKYGVRVGNEFVMSVNKVDPREVPANPPLENPNELAKLFPLQAMPFKTVRVVRPDSGAIKYKAEVLLQVEPTLVKAWEEDNVKALRNPVGFLLELIESRVLWDKLASRPVPIAVNVTEEGSKPRLVVFGDTEFLSNFEMTRSQASDDHLYSLFVSSLNWLAERQGLGGLRPKETQNFALNLNPDVNPEDRQAMNRLLLLPGWLMCLGIFGLGTGIWLVRRR